MIVQRDVKRSARAVFFKLARADLAAYRAVPLAARPLYGCTPARDNDVAGPVGPVACMEGLWGWGATDVGRGMARGRGVGSGQGDLARRGLGVRGQGAQAGRHQTSAGPVRARQAKRRARTRPGTLTGERG